MRKVLITAIGSFSANISIRNLKEAGFDLIGCDIYPKEWIANAYLVEKFYQAPYASDRDRYFQFVQKICRQEQIDYIVPAYGC